MNSYFRLDYATASEHDTCMCERRLPEKPIGLPMKVRGGNFVLAAQFNYAARLGEVRAIGRIVRATDRVEVEWCRAEFDLRPTANGVPFWRKDHFKFAANVADRYMLEAICAEHFPETGMAQNGKCAPMSGESDSSSGGASGTANAGHVYVIRSPYGYKIGKTRTLRDRTRLFAVKLTLLQHDLDHHTLVCQRKVHLLDRPGCLQSKKLLVKRGVFHVQTGNFEIPDSPGLSEKSQWN